MRSVFCLIILFPCLVWAQEPIVNIYAWTGEVPDFIVHQFTQETGIKVNLSTYENNELMYTKLRAAKNAGYDLVMPSSYFVDRMRRQNMLERLDKTKLTHWRHLDPSFLNPTYDPHTEYSVPYIWGVTGIFLNTDYFSEKKVRKWSDLWDKRYQNQLLLLDDAREVFSIGLLSLGYPANDRNAQHIKEAFLKLKKLMQNVKVFSSDTVISIMIDEDATIGMAWNGDTFKAEQENKKVTFIFPQDGFVIWVDNFAIPKQAPHKETAYQFINFILRPDIAKAIALYTGYPITNASAQKQLPPHIRQNTSIYPPKAILRRGQFQTDLSDEVLALYEKYWEELKIGG